MTNREIISMAKLAHGVEETVHTYAQWRKEGFKVKKGEHAAFKAKIWVFQKEVVEVEEGKFEQREGFILKTAAFFTESQVEAA